MIKRTVQPSRMIIRLIRRIDRKRADGTGFNCGLPAGSVEMLAAISTSGPAVFDFGPVKEDRPGVWRKVAMFVSPLQIAE
jgi:hypothetical protein